MQDVLFYFSQSADKPPGKGKNESVANPADYATLRAIPHWRKILSNFYVGPFTWNGHRWNSVEHAFQASKIALVDSRQALHFTLDSGYELGRGDGLAARKARKLVLLDASTLREWDRIKSSLMEDILFAKFSQVPEATAALRATREAILLHGARGPPERQMELERVRRRLRQ